MEQMATPLITFKAGQCGYEADVGATVTPDPTPGYIYIIQDDGLHHFCWRPRSALYTDPTLDLIMFPTDATFEPYRPANAKSAIAGRVYVLKFSSSSVRHLFWLQSSGNSSEPSEFSARDLKIGEIVNSILQGEEVDVTNELQNLPSGESGGDSGDDDDDDDADDDDEDTAMEDAEVSGSRASVHQAASGGAGAGATGGDIREEGEESRDGGADGGRALTSNQPSDPTQAAISNFLLSLRNTNLSTPQNQQPQQPQDHPFPTLQTLLSPPTTLSILSTLPPKTLDTLLSHLPAQILLLSSGLTPTEITQSDAPDSDTLSAISLSLPPHQKCEILAKVLRSPQFMQSLSGLTTALRDGGLPMIAEALGVAVKDGGMVVGGKVPLGGGSAVRGFVEGVRLGVESRKSDAEDGDEDEEMD